MEELGNDPMEIFQTVAKLDKFRNFEDAKNALNWANRVSSDYLLDTEGKELQAEATTLLNEFNVWLFKYITFGIKKEAARAPVPVDSTSE